MRDLLRISDEDRGHLRINVEHHLQMLPVALQGGHSNHIIQHGGDHILLFCRGQRALHNLRIVQHIVDLVGKTLPRQLDGRHIRPGLRRERSPQRHLADPDHHVDGRAELVGHVG